MLLLSISNNWNQNMYCHCITISNTSRDADHLKWIIGLTDTMRWLRGLTAHSQEDIGAPLCQQAGSKGCTPLLLPQAGHLTAPVHQVYTVWKAEVKGHIHCCPSGQHSLKGRGQGSHPHLSIRSTQSEWYRSRVTSTAVHQVYTVKAQLKTHGTHHLFL